MPEGGDPVATAQDLTRALQVTAAEVRRLRRYGRHNRWFIAVDVLLTVLLSAFGAVSVHAVQQAGRANSAQLALCQAGNVSRAQQIQLWQFVVDLPPTRPRTVQDKANIARFEAYLHSVFAQRDCQKLGR